MSQLGYKIPNLLIFEKKKVLWIE